MNDKFNESFNKQMSRFSNLTEAHSSRIPDNRARTGGFHPGDRIQFSDSISTSDWYKAQAADIQQLVQELRDGDLNLFVDDVHGEADDVKLVVTRELAPGLQCPHSKVELPSTLCELLGSTGSRAEAPIPDSWRGPERVTIKPEPVKPFDEEVADSPENQTLKADDGSGKLVDTDHTMTDKNTPGAKGGTYTMDYMPKG